MKGFINMGASSNDNHQLRKRNSGILQLLISNQFRKQSGLICIVCVCILVLTTVFSSSPKQEGSASGVIETVNTKMVVDFQCPTTDKTNQTLVEEEYVDPKQQPVFDDHFLETFRDVNYDGWGHSFSEIKGRLYDWKADKFAPYLHNGSTIFESACGLGLNLFLTLEIIQETANLGNITVYGNEYIAQNAAKASPMLQVLLKNQSAGNTVGRICQGDSTDLQSWVTTSANHHQLLFDLVYTGYMSPLYDPLEFGLGSDAKNYNRMKQICRNAAAADDDEKKHWMGSKLAAIAQKRQEDWAAKWVTEMVSIAKPGAPVIFEEVALPYCDIRHDYGGVSLEFWKTGRDVYGWDIESGSIDYKFKNEKKRRYHVFMLKRKE